MRLIIHFFAPRVDMILCFIIVEKIMILVSYLLKIARLKRFVINEWDIDHKIWYKIVTFRNRNSCDSWDRIFCTNGCGIFVVLISDWNVFIILIFFFIVINLKRKNTYLDHRNAISILDFGCKRFDLVTFGLNDVRIMNLGWKLMHKVEWLVGPQMLEESNQNLGLRCGWALFLFL